MYLGATWDVSDSNGTTCLHSACRAGSVAVVAEFIRNSRLVEASDSASWTPLHIAAHMGRRKVVIQLLRARASPYRRNAMGQTPVQLCLDQGTREALCGLSRKGMVRDGNPLARPNPRLLVTQLATSVHSDGMVEEEEEGEDQSEARGVRRSSLDSTEEASPYDARGRGTRPQVMQPACDFDSEEAEDEDRVGVPIQCEPELFFVTPSPVVKQVGFYKKVLLQLAVKVFNLNPCYGVAFAVMSGLADNYTGAMKCLLRSPEVDRFVAGTFLADAFSVCHLIRFGVLDSLAFLHTSVIGALVLAFRAFRLPNDLEKVHRLVHSVAVVWWRKHRLLIKEGSADPTKSFRDAGGDLAGLGLLQYLASSDVLAQLMFSAIMLHWIVHCAPELPRGRTINLHQWLLLNTGIEEGGTDVPDFVQEQIYNRITNECLMELGCSPFGSLDLSTFLNRRRLIEDAEADAAAGTRPIEDVDEEEEIPSGSLGRLLIGEEDVTKSIVNLDAPPLHSMAAMDGWVQLLGGALPSHAKNHAADGMLGELTGAAAVSMGDRAFGAVPEAPGPPSEGHVWATIASIFFLIAVSPVPGSPQAAPHAVTDARRLHVLAKDPNTLRLTLGGLPMQGDLDLQQKILIGLLLPDGRWREISIDRLDLKAPSEEELDKWQSAIERTRSSSTCKV